MTTGLLATFSKYRVVTRLGSGGMAEVYLVFSERPGGFHKLQVLKLMRSDLTELERPEFLQMFEDEARLAARLNHPHIVQSFEVGAEEGQPYIVMEFLEGQSLHRVQQRARHLGGGFSMDMELFVLCQVLEGLEYAHSLTDYAGNRLHIVHRDVSPQNVFITYSGLSKLVDFGVAKTLESSKTRAGVVKGKVAYMPPEQVKSGPIDHRADLFSAGVLLWEAIAGLSMHADLSVYESMSRLVRGDLPKIREFNPRVSAELERIVQRALAIDPNERYQDAESFRGDLFAYLDAHSRVRARDVGAAVAQLFKNERAELSQIIRRATTPGAPRPKDEQDGRPITRRLPQDDLGHVPAPVSDEPTHLATPATPVRPESGPPMTEQKPAPSSSGGVSRRLRMFALGVVAALIIAFIGTQYILRSQSELATTAPEQALPPAAAPTDEPAPAPATVQVAIDVVPRAASATISLDGRVLGQSPYRAPERRDASEHTLSVTAPGYVPLQRAVSLQGDLTLALQLEAARGEERAPSKSVGPAPVAPRRDATRPAPTPRSSAEPYIDLPAPKAVKRNAPELDKDDPWTSESRR